MRCSMAALFTLGAFAASCGGDGVDSPGNHGPYPFTNIAPPANGVAQFTVLPVSIANGLTLTALGSVNPPGHVLPTDHVYFYDWDLSSGTRNQSPDDRTVYMPTTAAVIQTLKPTGTDTKVIRRPWCALRLPGR